MAGRLEGRVAAITGASSGIGEATALAFAREGAAVALGARREERIEEPARRIEADGGRAAAIRVDVSDEQDAHAFIGGARERLGGLDVLVNNAGMGRSHPFLEFPLDAWRDTLDVSLTGAFVCAQRAARLMVEAGTKGRIINITSVHEHIPLPESAAYCAAKGGLGLLTKVMALELGEHGITVNAVAPGEISTPMTGQEDVDPETEERPVPVGRPGSAHEVAAVVSFLASPRSSYVTGSSYVVDGGLMLIAAQANQ
jgi:NAD(P)-dependent dehydrogenase (short-subunit alcohol dehydrogenase family)